MTGYNFSLNPCWKCKYYYLNIKTKHLSVEDASITKTVLLYAWLTKHGLINI